MLQQLAAEAVGVLARRMRQLVDEALDGKGVLRAADRAPEHHRHMRVLEHALGELGRHVVGHVLQALDGGRLDAILDLAPPERAHDRAHGRTRLPPRRHAVRSQRSPEADRRLRPVAVLADVLLAAPDQLDRPPDRLGDRHRLHQLVVHRAPAEPAAQIAGVDLHRRLGHARRLGRELQRRLGVLRSHPDVDPTVLDPGRAVERLHRGMRQMRHLVERLDHPAIRQGGRNVSLLARNHRRPIQGPAIIVSEPGAVGAGSIAIVPLDGQDLERFLCPPEAVGHDRHPAGHRHHRQHATPAQHRLLVDTNAACRRRPGKWWPPRRPCRAPARRSRTRPCRSPWPARPAAAAACRSA